MTLPQHSKATVEQYTPPKIIDAARFVMGDIDLDPASSALANRTVRATTFYTQEQDGFAKEWCGNVWLNPPGGDAPSGLLSRSYAACWYVRLAAEWQLGRVKQAVFLGFTLEILRSVQGLTEWFPLGFPTCIPSSRLRFWTPNRPREKSTKRFAAGTLLDPAKPVGELVRGDSPAHANIVVYLPPRGVDMAGGVERFEAAFSPIGQVTVPYEWSVRAEAAE